MRKDIRQRMVAWLLIPILVLGTLPSYVLAEQATDGESLSVEQPQEVADDAVAIDESLPQDEGEGVLPTLPPEDQAEAEVPAEDVSAP